MENSYTSIKDVLFGVKDRVIIIIDPRHVDRAEEISNEYEGKQILKSNTKSWFIEGGIRFKLDSDEPNKTTLSYIVNSNDTSSLTRDLMNHGIAGTHRYNPVYSRPYSIRSKIASLEERLNIDLREWIPLWDFYQVPKNIIKGKFSSKKNPIRFYSTLTYCGLQLYILKELVKKYFL